MSDGQVMTAKLYQDIDNPSVRETFSRLRDTVGSDVAFFVCCAFLDVPYSPKISAADWGDYLAQLKTRWAREFKDGATDIREAVKRGMGDKERWIATWGPTYSEADYRQLDEIFATLSRRSGDTMDPQQELTLRYCAKLALLRDKCIVQEDKESVDRAKNYDAMFQKNLEAENLRGREAKNQTERLDGIVDSLKRRFGYGKELTQAQAIEVVAKWYASHHYNMTVDAADHMLLSILNATRTNSDLPTFSTLPEDASLAPYEREFEPEGSAVWGKENSVIDYLGLARKPREENPII